MPRHSVEGEMAYEGRDYSYKCTVCTGDDALSYPDTVEDLEWMDAGSPGELPEGADREEVEDAAVKAAHESLYRDLRSECRFGDAGEPRRYALELVKEHPWEADGRTVLIWSGEHSSWWGWDNKGYTGDRSAAGRYSFRDAFRSTRHCGPEKRIEFVVEERVRRIVCAACRLPGGKVVAGVRHMDRTMRSALGTGETLKGSVQGFLDSGGVFLCREEALAVAREAGQILYRCGGDGKALFSDNLY